MTAGVEHPEDPYLWLEDITGERALDFARTRGERAAARFASSERFDEIRGRILDMLDTDTKIPYPSRRGRWFYNYWRDAAQPRGVWRRTTFEEYSKDDPDWEVLLDLDAVAAAEEENWVWGGASVFRPDQTRALLSLSRGGADAKVVREFDMLTKKFVSPKDDGFTLPEAKSQIGWIDIDTVYVGTDFGPGSLTESGYPRIAKRWRRGTSLSQAETIFEGKPSDVAVTAGYDRTPGFERHFVSRATDFFNEDVFLVQSDDSVVRLDVPTDAGISWYRDWLLIRTKSPWSVGDREYGAGMLLVADFPKFLVGQRDLEVLFAPDAHTSLHGYAWTENHLIIRTLQDVQTKLSVLTPGRDGWRREPLTETPDMASTSLLGLDPLEGGDEYLLSTSGFTTPSTLLANTVGGKAVLLKQAPHFFDATRIGTEQFFATSDDGTAIPYFVIRREDLRDKPAPTVVSGYGGFEVSRTPSYAGAAGIGWLERGGVWVMANIRGGGEYGPQWHTATQKARRHKVYEDFAAVARDLVARGVCSAAQLGAVGGSNGGLLMGVMLTHYPELFGAIVCQVPLLDMSRYHKLLAGASWIAEYGDPDDPAEWEYLKEYSPYHNASATRKYPPVLLTTSTRDDRVHPGHARKMTALLEAQGHRVWYHENIEGGHSGAADNKQSAFQAALIYEFFSQQLIQA